MKKLLGVISVAGATATGYWNHLKSLPVDQKINIVFDLDHTIIRSKHTDNLSDLNLNGNNPTFTILDDTYSVWTRPYSGVIKQLAKIANLHVFTSADDDYANEIINKMYGKRLFNKILTFETWEEDESKNLLKVSDSKNTILVDDKLYNNYSKDQLFYHIPQFEIQNRHDKELLKLYVYILVMYIKNEFA